MNALHAHFATVGALPFGYGPGKADCAAFALRWIETVRGCRIHDLPVYETKAQARAAVRLAGGMYRLAVQSAATLGLHKTQAPLPGDIGLVRAGRRRLVFGICAGEGLWAVKTERGVATGPLACVVAWQPVNRAVRSLGAEAVGLLLLTSIGVTEAAAGAALIGTLTGSQIVGALTLTAASIGLQYALASNRPKTDQSALQQVSRGSTDPRMRHYGTVKVAGALVFSEAKGSKWHQVLALGQGRIDGIAQVYLNNKPVTISATPPYIVTSGKPGQFVEVQTRAGLATETAYAALTAAFPAKWTSDHRGDGVASCLLTITNPGDRYFTKWFPNGVPAPSIALRGARVHDPRQPAQLLADSSTWVWSANAGLVIRDWLMHEDGNRTPPDLINHQSFTNFANLSDYLVPLKGGGSEPRWRINGSYSFGEQRRDTLSKLTAACAARVYLDAGGQISIGGGQYIVPEWTLNRSAIILAEWEYGRDVTERINEWRPVFISPSHDYRQVEAHAWSDENAIATDGLRTSALDLPMVGSHTQAQRLAKIMGKRGQAKFIGKLTCNILARQAFQQETIRVVDPAHGIDADFQIDNYIEDFVAKTITLDVTSIAASNWAFDPDTEEGAAPPIPPDTSSDNDIEVPTSVGAVVIPVNLSTGVTGAQIQATWDAPAQEGLTPEVQYRQRISTGPDVFGSWVSARLEPGATEFLSGVIANDSSLYEVQVRFLVSARTSEWSSTVSVVAASDGTAPSVITGLSLTGGAGQITADWTAPASTNYAGSRIYWNTSNSLTGATLVATVYGVQSQSHNRVITGLSAGTRWVLITAINGSGVASSAVSASATVT